MVPVIESSTPTVPQRILEGQYLQSVVELLWGQPHGERPGEASSEAFAILPGRARPRMLVPLSNRKVTAAALALTPSTASRLTSAGRATVSRVVRGLTPRALPAPRLRVAPTSDGLLQRICDLCPVPVASVAVLLGTPKPNRKPLLWLFDDDGEPVAFAKVGWDEVTSGLVDREATALATLSRRDLRCVRPPQLRTALSLRDHHAIVTEPLPIRPRPRPTPRHVALAAGEIAALDDLERAPLRHTSYAAELLARVQALGSSPERDRLVAATEDLIRSHADSPVAIGRWHGDFRPWNMAAAGTRLLLWDWERFGDRGPLGLDGVHFHHPTFRPGEDPAAFHHRVEKAWRRGTPLLAAMGVADPLVVRRLHLVELAHRVLAGSAADPFAPRRARLLLHAVEESRP